MLYMIPILKKCTEFHFNSEVLLLMLKKIYFLLAGTDCLYKGISYKHGQTFKDECNTCTCNDGRAACTLMACRK